MKVYTLICYADNKIDSVHGVFASRELAQEKGYAYLNRVHGMAFDFLAEQHEERYGKRYMIDEWYLQGFDEVLKIEMGFPLSDGQLERAIEHGANVTLKLPKAVVEEGDSSTHTKED